MLDYTKTSLFFNLQIMLKKLYNIGPWTRDLRPCHSSKARMRDRCECRERLLQSFHLMTCSRWSFQGSKSCQLWPGTERIKFVVFESSDGHMSSRTNFDEFKSLAMTSKLTLISWQKSWGQVIPVWPKCVINVSVKKDSFKVVLWWHVAIEAFRTPKAVDYDLETKGLNL